MTAYTCNELDRELGGNGRTISCARNLSDRLEKLETEMEKLQGSTPADTKPALKRLGDIELKDAYRDEWRFSVRLVGPSEDYFQQYDYRVEVSRLQGGVYSLWWETDVNAYLIDLGDQQSVLAQLIKPALLEVMQHMGSLLWAASAGKTP